MKKIKSIILLLLIAISTENVFGQVNPTIQVIGLGTLDPTNAGAVAVGATLDLLITVGNTGTNSILANRVRPVITLPPIVELLPNALQTGLPLGWSIVGNSTAQIIRICNGSDIIEGSGSRNVIIKVKGLTIGGPSTFTGQLTFGGAASCTTGGAAPGGNVTVDDFAPSTVTVVAAVVPLTLIDFSANIVSCQPSLNWTTVSEINTDRFEIERSDVGTNWKVIGTRPANGFSSITINYNFIDKNLNSTAEKVLYRLKMIDKDGTFKYSVILPVLVNCKETKVIVYPNPVQDGKLYVSLIGVYGSAEASLISANGQVVINSKISNGTNYINIINVANGIYILNIKDANGYEKNVKVSVMH